MINFSCDSAKNLPKKSSNTSEETKIPSQDQTQKPVPETKEPNSGTIVTEEKTPPANPNPQSNEPLDKKFYDLIHAHEELEFFPTYAKYNEKTKTWNLNIKGRIFDPNESTAVKTAAKTGFTATTFHKIKNDDDFWHKISGFCVDHIHEKRVKISFNGLELALPASSEAGMISGLIELTDEYIQSLKSSNGWITYKAISEDNREFYGNVQLENPSGTLIISDIDDTIKITENYENTRTVLNNTFNSPYYAPLGMGDLLADLTSRKSSSIHYLTGSPWQLYQPLREFFENENFQKGPFQMQTVRINPLSSEFFEYFIGDHQKLNEELKKNYIRQLINDFPEKTFILLGDSGEKDPEIYGWAVKNFPNQIEKIYIRNVTDEKTENIRMNTAFGIYIQKLFLIDMNDGEIYQ